ncbi:MAG: sulfatase-like hydrolase/transferase, partial [Planctomycetes bacterium]|nr:sulfatase-like hydrolase/transferase [Planctomycetota bacterium]
AIHDVTREASGRYALPKNLAGEGLKRDSIESADVSDGYYIDGIVCRDALAALRSLKAGSQPFFLAVGFRKPHLPFCAPKKYWDYYKRDDIPPPVSNAYPNGAPELAVRSWKELEGYRDIPDDGSLSKEKVAELRHGYYACVSYVDALAGRLLDELERLELREDTVVILWGDHGFHLGEQGLWAKANNYELSTCSPLILSVPGQPNSGAVCQALVEFVDVYPTLTEACGLPVPDGLEGVSMLPLFKDPAQPWKRAAFSQYPRDFKDNRHKGHGDIMGYAVRTKRYRYVQWRQWDTGKVLARELYDHSQDVDEMKNIADNPEYKDIISELGDILKTGWKAVLPPT